MNPKSIGTFLSLRHILAMLLLAGFAQATPPTTSGSLNVEQVNLLGLSADDHFGASIAGRGDFNGDGHRDWVAGAPYADVAADASGAAYLFLGGEFSGSAPVSVLAGEAANDQAGISVAAGFNLNGDAYDDVAVGVRLHDGGAGDGGAVFVYFGSANPSAQPTPDLKLFAEAGGDWFGNSVSSAGDVNGDGFDDLIVGAPYNDSNANAAGRAYLVFGAATVGAVSMTPLDGASLSNAHFGWSVGGGGDLNNDGYDDVVVGARLHGTGPNGAAGRAYVFLGGDPFDTTADLIVEGEAKNDWFGESVAVLGDVNGDGFDDWIGGAHFRDPGGVSAAGEASVFLGGNPLDGIRDLRVAGSGADAQAGKAVGSGGDLDGDSFADILVGEHFAETAGGGASAGQVFFLRGGATLDNAVDLTLAGNQANGHLGASVASIGSLVSGSGEVLAVGAPLDAEAALGAGQVTLVRAATDGPQIAGLTLSGLDVLYDGSPQPVIVTTDPPGLAVEVTYDGDSVAPSAVGSYLVAVEVMEPGYEGSANETLVINPSFLSWAEGFGLVSADPAADDDGDGIAAVGEYLFNTSPTDASSRPAFNLTLTETEFTLEVPPIESRPDAVLGAEASSDLLTWDTTNHVATENGFSIPLDGSKGFLRLRFTYQAP